MTARLGLRLLGAAAAMALAACGDVRHDLRGEEPQIIAWWFEDVAHGIPRRPEELRLVDGSERMDRIAEWAEGSSIRGVREPPRPIKARCTRLALLSTMLSQGQAVVLADSGLIAPKPDLPRDDAELVEPVVDAENQDRRMLDAVVISMAQAHDAQAEAYLSAVRAARVELDQRAGGSLWVPKK
jgi:hypothetical protein